MSFRGRIARNVDNQGRLMLPPEYREELLARSEGGVLMLTTLPGDPCLVGYPLPLWREIEHNLKKIENPSKRLKAYERAIVGGAQQMVPDAQGRIRLAEDHLRHAEISAEAVLQGSIDCFEIWQPQRLEAVLQQDFSDIRDELPPGTGRIF